MELPYIFSLLGLFPKELKSECQKCTVTFIVAFLTTDNTCKQPKYPPTGDICMQWNITQPYEESLSLANADDLEEN